MRSSNGFLERLELPIDDGRLASGLRIIWSIPASLAILQTDIPANCRWVLGLAVGGFLVGDWLVHRARRNTTRRYVVGGNYEHWTLMSGDARPVRGRLVDAWGVMHGPVIGLRWEFADGRTCQAWVVKWVTPSQSWRRLRARLRLS